MSRTFFLKDSIRELAAGSLARLMGYDGLADLVTSNSYLCANITQNKIIEAQINDDFRPASNTFEGFVASFINEYIPDFETQEEIREVYSISNLMTVARGPQHFLVKDVPARLHDVPITLHITTSFEENNGEIICNFLLINPATKHKKPSSVITDARWGFPLAEIPNGVPGAFFIYKTNDDEEIIFANKALYKLYECENTADFKEFTGCSFRGLVHPDDLEEVEDSIWDQIGKFNRETGADPVDFVKYRIVTKKGNVKTIQDIGKLVHSQIYGDVFFVVMYEISE
jgi:hypothetical protein